MSLVRDGAGRFLATRAAMLRFVEKCEFDPRTGCVLWIGGTTSGRGHNSPYGSFWFEGRRWFAHRWAAKHIHGQTIDNMQVDHCCPHTNAPNTLCVEHVQSVLPSLNRELQWIRTQVGIIDPPPAYVEDVEAVPFFIRPAWLGAVLRGEQRPCPGGQGGKPPAIILEHAH